MKTIVLGMDGSEGAKRAVPVAVGLVRQAGARLVIAYIDERIAAKGDMLSLRADPDEVRAEIGRVAEEITAEGIEATVEDAVVVLGGPAHAIPRIADDVDAEMIVVGNRGHSPVAGLLLGSVTERLLHIAKRPVLAVPPPE